MTLWSSRAFSSPVSLAFSSSLSYHPLREQNQLEPFGSSKSRSGTSPGRSGFPSAAPCLHWLLAFRAGKWFSGSWQVQPLVGTTGSFGNDRCLQKIPPKGTAEGGGAGPRCERPHGRPDNSLVATTLRRVPPRPCSFPPSPRRDDLPSSKN